MPNGIVFMIKSLIEWRTSLQARESRQDRNPRCGSARLHSNYRSYAGKHRHGHVVICQLRRQKLQVATRHLHRSMPILYLTGSR